MRGGGREGEEEERKGVGKGGKGEFTDVYIHADEDRSTSSSPSHIRTSPGPPRYCCSREAIRHQQLLQHNNMYRQA